MLLSRAGPRLRNVSRLLYWRRRSGGLLLGWGRRCNLQVVDDLLYTVRGCGLLGSGVTLHLRVHVAGNRNCTVRALNCKLLVLQARVLRELVLNFAGDLGITLRRWYSGFIAANSRRRE